jgi:hypothetical protein
MKLRVAYVVHITKDVRRMVNWKSGLRGMAEMPEVVEFYRKYGTIEIDAFMSQWRQEGRP